LREFHRNRTLPDGYSGWCKECQNAASRRTRRENLKRYRAMGREWLGHADPGFTLRTYVHLMDAGVGDAEFFDNAVVAGPDAQRERARVNA
jgi:hypothetical protein